MTSAELHLIKSSEFPRQVIVGRYDRLARTSKVLQLSKDMRAPLLILGRSPHSPLPIWRIRRTALDLASLLSEKMRLWINLTERDFAV